MRHVAPLSGRFAVFVAAVATLAIGIGVGNVITPVGVAGALAFGWGAGALDSFDRGSDGLDAVSNSRRALGSIATAVGGLLVLVGASAGGSDFGAAVVTSLALFGLVAVAVDATAGFGDDSLAPVLTSLGSSIASVIAGVALFGVLYVALTLDLAGLLVGGLADVSLATALGGFVSLQLLALLVAVAMSRSRRIVEGWFPGGVPVESWDEFEPLALTVSEVPREYWGVLGLQVLLLIVPGVVGLVQALLSETWLFGDALGFLLQSGLLHGLLGLVLLLELTVIAAELVRSASISLLSPDPPKSLSNAAGGLTLVAGAPVVVGAVTLLASVTGTGTDLLFFGGTLGSAAALLSLSVVALGIVFALEVTGVAVAMRSFLPDRAAGFAMGATLLFVAAVVASRVGAIALVTFVGIAAALVTWDLGETAVDVGSHLGEAAETRRAEVVHATGSIAVGTAGIALSVLAVHALGPLPNPGAGRAGAALALTLVALVAFVLAIDRRPEVQ